MESKQVAQELLKLASALVEAGGGVVPLKITKIGPKLWWFPLIEDRSHMEAIVAMAKWCNSHVAEWDAGNWGPGGSTSYVFLSPEKLTAKLLLPYVTKLLKRDYASDPEELKEMLEATDGKHFHIYC